MPNQNLQHQQKQQRKSNASINPWQAHRTGNIIASESSMKADEKQSKQSQLNDALETSSAASNNESPTPIVSDEPGFSQAPHSSMDISNSIMCIIHPYDSTLDDELTLEVGGTVILLKSFDDGWALGLDTKTGARGAFPMICVVADDGLALSHTTIEDTSSAGVKRQSRTRFSKRISSAMASAEQMSALNALAEVSQELLKARGVKFHSKVPNMVHIYPRESMLSSPRFSYISSEDETDVTSLA